MQGLLKREPSLIAVIAGIDNNAILPGIGERNLITALAGASAHGNAMLVYGSDAEKLVLPVLGSGMSVIFESHAFVDKETLLVTRVELEHILHILIGVHHLHLPCDLLETYSAVVFHFRLSHLPLAGFNHDDTVGSAGTVNGRGGGILEDGERFDIGAVQT